MGALTLRQMAIGQRAVLKGTGGTLTRSDEREITLAGWWPESARSLWTHAAAHLGWMVINDDALRGAIVGAPADPEAFG